MSSSRILDRLKNPRKKVRGRASRVADDDSGAFFAQHASLFGLGTPVPAFLSTEEAKHTGWLVGVGVL